MQGSNRQLRSVEGRPLEDAELVGLARDGDVRAYEELVGRYRDVAFRTAWLVTRSSADAEDAAQEAFVKAYYAMPRFRPGAPFKPWLLRIVANEAKNRGRSGRRREALAQRAAAASGERQALLEAIGRLPVRDRVVLAYRYYFDLSEAEMAEALDCRPGTVKSRLSRATAHLRDELGGTS